MHPTGLRLQDVGYLEYQCDIQGTLVRKLHVVILVINTGGNSEI